MPEIFHQVIASRRRSRGNIPRSPNGQHSILAIGDRDIISLYFHLYIVDNSLHCLNYGLPESIKYVKGTVHILEESNDCYTLE